MNMINTHLQVQRHRKENDNAHKHLWNNTEVEQQVPRVRLKGRIKLNFSTTYAVDCGA